MSNYIRHKFQGCKVYMKPGVVPHIFKCQESLPQDPKRRKGEKRKRLDVGGAGLQNCQATASTSAAENIKVESDTSDFPVTIKMEFFDESIESSGTAAREEEPKEQLPLEPTIEIKEEPLDYEPTPSTSTEPANDEFILPHEESNTWTPPVHLPPDPVVEPQLTLSIGCLTSPNHSENPDGDQTRKKRKIKASTFVPSTNGPEARSQSPVYNFGDSSNPGSSKETRKDQFDVFGEYIAAKLRNLDRRSCAYAQRAIGDIIFEAEMGKYLNEDSDCKSLKNCAS